MLRFKTANTELEFSALHPVIKDLISRLATYCEEEGLPDVVLTECLRTPENQEQIYWRQMMREFSLNEDAARKKARNKDSLHLYGCAADLRDKHYTVAQKKEVVSWLRTEMAKISRKPGFWEFLPDIHGTGSHIHIGRKDHQWIKDYRAKADKPFEIVVGIKKSSGEPSI